MKAKDLKKIIASDKYNLLKGQRCGTYYQQKSYALIYARELYIKIKELTNKTKDNEND